MNRISRFLIGVFGAAALYYIFGRVLWPGDNSPIGEIPRAALFGLMLEALHTERVRLTKQATEPYPPRFYFATGLTGLVAYVAFWIGLTLPPTGAELFGLLAAIALSLYLLASGFTMLRRSHAQGVGSGT